MEASNFTTSFSVKQSPQEVFSAINNVRGWWQGEIMGKTLQLYDEFTYVVEGVHYSKQKVTEFDLNKKVVWLVTESKLSFAKDQQEWTGTRIVFEICEVNNQTKLHFAHEGLVPQFECYGACSNAWGLLVGESLFSLITTGKGKKVFNDV